jgi:hypothetical protein
MQRCQTQQQLKISSTHDPRAVGSLLMSHPNNMHDNVFLRPNAMTLKGHCTDMSQWLNSHCDQTLVQQWITEVLDTRKLRLQGSSTGKMVMNVSWRASQERLKPLQVPNTSHWSRIGASPMRPNRIWHLDQEAMKSGLSRDVNPKRPHILNRQSPDDHKHTTPQANSQSDHRKPT